MRLLTRHAISRLRVRRAADLLKEKMQLLHTHTHTQTYCILRKINFQRRCTSRANDYIRLRRSVVGKFLKSEGAFAMEARVYAGG